MSIKLIILTSIILLNSLHSQIQFYKEGNLYGVKDIQGSDVILPIFEEVQNSGEGTFTVKVDGKWGLLNHTGEYLLNCIYDSISSFKNGYSIICFNKKYGHIDKFGNIITKTIYDKVYDFNNGFSRVELNGKWGVITSQGKCKLETKYDIISRQVYGISLIKLDEKYGLLDKEFNKITPLEYTQYKWLSKKHIALTKKSTSDIYNISDNSLKVIYSTNVQPFSSKFFRIKKGEFWGLKDFSGKWFLRPEYLEISDLKDKMARIKINNLYGFIDNNGQIIFEPQFVTATPFSKGLAKIQNGEKWQWINTKGKVILTDEDIEAESKTKVTSPEELQAPSNIEMDTINTLEAIQSKNRDLIRANEIMYYNSYPGYFYRPYYRQRYLNRCRPIIQYNGSRWNLSLGGCGLRLGYNTPPHFTIRF